MQAVPEQAAELSTKRAENAASAPVAAKPDPKASSPNPATKPTPKPSNTLTAPTVPGSAGGRAANDPREIKRRAMAAQKEQDKSE